MTDRELMELAVKARGFSYAPYSDFHVGAALLGIIRLDLLKKPEKEE